ncbi:hypothetical protein [Actinoplanes regularis]|nr:hypothetical protein [Actinoplanes regularis]
MTVTIMSGFRGEDLPRLGLQAEPWRTVAGLGTGWAMIGWLD